MAKGCLKPKRYYNLNINWLNVFLIFCILSVFVCSILYVAWSYQATIGF